MLGRGTGDCEWVAAAIGSGWVGKGRWWHGGSRGPAHPALTPQGVVRCDTTTTTTTTTTGPTMPLFYDTGIRSGEDIVKAYALGADFVFVGRPFLFAIAGSGEQGKFLPLQHGHKQLRWGSCPCNTATSSCDGLPPRHSEAPPQAPLNVCGACGVWRVAVWRRVAACGGV